MWIRVSVESEEVYLGCRAVAIRSSIVFEIKAGTVGILIRVEEDVVPVVLVIAEPVSDS